MLQRTHYPQNEKINDARKNFKNKFPNKAAVEGRINAALSGASNIGQLKTAVKKILLGEGNEPGLADALFDLDR